LKEAIERVTDYDGRVEGSRVKWPGNWQSAFNPAVLANIGSFITACRTDAAPNEASQEQSQ